MRLLSQLVRRATTRTIERTAAPKSARPRGKSPRARLRADALSMLG